jgi:LemA protein
MNPLYVLLGVSLLLVVIVIVLYNGLVTARMRVKEAWSDIEVQFKRRFDLIPNLIETVKGSANFETTTLEKVIQARGQVLGSNSPKEFGAADVQTKAALTGFFGLAESYPDLKTNASFVALQSELSDTENKIQAARRFYNAVVSEYNTKIQTIPTNIFAKMFSFVEAEFFELDENEQSAKNPVKVSF